MKTSPFSIDESERSASGIHRDVLRKLAVLLVLVAVILIALYCWPHRMSSRGGLPIPGEIVIEVPQFFQGDSRWGNESLGETPGTLGAEGCAVSSAAMTLGFYGMDIDPKRLNRFLTDHQGYEGKGWLKWESAAGFAPGIVEKAYEDLPSYRLIDWNLLHGNPVIVRIRRSDGITHFVVIVGKRGFDYLIRDPAGYGKARGGRIYRLAELGVPIEALRYYRRL